MHTWKADLGSSSRRRPGWVCVDIDAAVRPDVVANFNTLPLPFKTGALAEVSATQVAEHLHIHLIEFLQEVYRILAPNGNLHIAVPNMFSLKNRALYVLGRIPTSREWNPHHLKLIPASYLFQLLRHIGFDPRPDYTRLRWLPFRHFFSGSLCILARKRL